jgi:phosphatidylserine/phosphatidylglycerophosphate/cardiolipin synthase-like enzyme
VSRIEPAPRDAGHVSPARSGAYPLRCGNAVRPLVDGEAAFGQICRAVEAARRSVWVTVAYVERDVPMPDGRGSFFDVLDRAARRGLDVRALFWREPRLREIEPGSRHFPGDADERRWLANRGARFLARWDRHPDACCHHQKSWLVDAGGPGEVAFVGGINLLATSVVARGHPAWHGEGEQDHDVYLELRGPAATDVHHNFAQRWNQASERNAPDGAWPAPERVDDLPFPAEPSAQAGDAAVQVTRTVRADLYQGGPTTPGGEAFDVAGGETSVLEQYLAAIGAARRAIYVEDQAIGSPAIVDALGSAAERGVEVVFLVPGSPHPAFVEARANPRAAFFFERLAELGRHDRFTLAAIAGSRPDGGYDEIYVHAKIMLVDDAWATIGSTNVADRSFQLDTELNASIWHEASVRALRAELLHEHLGRDTSGLDAAAACRVYRELAQANARRRAAGERLDGLAYALDASRYGL